MGWKMNTLVEWLKNHWFLLSSLLAVGTAWGQSVNKIGNLETRLAQTEAIVQNQTRLDERTIIMQQELKEHRQILMEIATTQRAIAQQQRVALPENPLSIPQAQQGASGNVTLKGR